MTPTNEQMCDRVCEAIEANTEKLQEILERVECMDNTMDDIKEEQGTQSNDLKSMDLALNNIKLSTENAIVLLGRIITQGRP